MPRILVIDDDPALAELLEALLEAADYEVVVANDGRAGLAAMTADPPPDAVVLDINLPAVDGFQVLEAVRDRPGPAPPILVLTARYGQDDARRARALGAADFLAKPFSNRTLLTRISALLRPR
ncbi:MAG TPA: response regulator [Caulobacteraceae bacterium]|nr:response regulator [Caulobacteraceae bacterium]